MPSSQASHNFSELFELGVEEALQQSVFDFFPGIIYVYDAGNKKLSYVNRRISNVLGYTLDDLKSWDQDLNKLVFPEDIEAVQKELAKYESLKDEESHSYDCRFNHKDGAWRHFQVMGKVVKRDEKGKPTSLLFIAQDVSENVKAANDLKLISSQIRDKEQLMAEYKEQVDVKEEFLECGSWEIVMGDKFISWSDGMYRLFGYDPKEDRANLVVDEDLYRSHMTGVQFEKAAQFRQNMPSTENSYCREYEILTKGGETKRIETFAKLYRDKNGEVIRVLGTTHNITRLRNFEKELEQNIIKLKDSISSLEEFTYIASHDIQEPLRKIASFTERMKSKFSDDLNEEARNYLDRIIVTSKSAHLLIDGLMKFLQLDNLQQHYKKTDLNVLLEEVKGELDLRLEAGDATILAGKLPVLEIIPLQIKQLLINIMLNAFKFRKPETLLVIDINSRKLGFPDVHQLALLTGPDYYEITIKDNGIGFKEDTVGKMFQMFQRFHNKSAYPGAGIGLAICKKIVDKHNGRIFASSVPGESSTFSIILPAKQASANGQN